MKKVHRVRTQLISSVPGRETLIKPYLFKFHLFILQVRRKFLLPFVSYFWPRKSEVTLFIVLLAFSGAGTEEFSKTFTLKEARGYAEKEHKRLKKIYPADFLSQFHRRLSPQSEADGGKK